MDFEDRELASLTLKFRLLKQVDEIGKQNFLQGPGENFEKGWQQHKLSGWSINPGKEEFWWQKCLLNHNRNAPIWVGVIIAR